MNYDSPKLDSTNMTTTPIKTNEKQRKKQRKNSHKKSPAQLKEAFNQGLQNAREKNQTTQLLFPVEGTQHERLTLEEPIYYKKKSRKGKKNISNIREEEIKEDIEETWTTITESTKKNKNKKRQQETKKNNIQKRTTTYKRTTVSKKDIHSSPKKVKQEKNALEERFHTKKQSYPKKQSPKKEIPKLKKKRLVETPRKERSTDGRGEGRSPEETGEREKEKQVELTKEELYIMESILGKPIGESNDDANKMLSYSQLAKELVAIKKAYEEEKRKNKSKRKKRKLSITSTTSSEATTASTTSTESLNSSEGRRRTKSRSTSFSSVTSYIPKPAGQNRPSLKVNVQSKRITEIKQMTPEKVNSPVPMSPVAEFQIRHVNGYEKILKTIETLFPEEESNMTLDRLLSLQPSMKRRGEKYFAHSKNQRNKQLPSHYNNYKHPIGDNSPKASPKSPFDPNVPVVPRDRLKHASSSSSWLQSSLELGNETPEQYVAHRFGEAVNQLSDSKMPMSPTMSPSYVQDSSPKFTRKVDYVGTPTTPMRSSPLTTTNMGAARTPSKVAHTTGFIHQGLFQTSFHQNHDASKNHQSTGIYKHANVRWEDSLRQ